MYTEVTTYFVITAESVCDVSTVTFTSTQAHRELFSTPLQLLSMIYND